MTQAKKRAAEIVNARSDEAVLIAEELLACGRLVPDEIAWLLAVGRPLPRRLDHAQAAKLGG